MYDTCQDMYITSRQSELVGRDILEAESRIERQLRLVIILYCILCSLPEDEHSSAIQVHYIFRPCLCIKDMSVMIMISVDG